MGIPIKIRSYNTGLSLYQNAKANLMADRMAKNRWGNKFKKYYNLHREPTADGTLGIYNFTAGMRASVMTISEAQNDLNRVNNFLTVFNEKMATYSGLTQTSSSVEVKAGLQNFVTQIPSAVIANITFTFTANPVQQDYVSWVNGNSELAYYLGLLAEGDVPDTVGQSVIVDVSFIELKAFLDERVVILTQTIDTLENDTSRIGEDLELIAHLGIEETLSKEIDYPQKIKKIWFQFQKEVSAPLVDDGAGGTTADPNYAWWEEAQFHKKTVTVEGKTHTVYGIADAIKDFQNYCVLDGNIVRLKEEVFELPGWKVYWFVNTFLGVDVEVKKKSWFARLFDFVLLVVAVYLTAMSSNPVWLKVIIIATQIGAYLGIVSPKVAFLVSVLSFSYGALNTNFSVMSSMQVFSWTVKNVEQVFKMVKMYDAIKIREQMMEDAKDANTNKSLVQQQDEVMEFIYNRSNDQYEEMVMALYNFSPSQRHIEY